MMHQAAILYCSGCLCKREFLPTPEAAENDPYPPVECVFCGYTYTIVEIDNNDGKPPIRKHALDHNIHDRGKREFLARFVSGIVGSGQVLRRKDKELILDGILSPE